MPATKQQIRQAIADNNLNSVADVYSLLRDSFKDILKEFMEAELDASFGYEKNPVKSQYGEFQIDVPRDRDGEFEPKLMQSVTPQTKHLPCQSWKKSGKNGEGNTPMQSVTGKTTGRMSAPSSSSPMISGASCIPQIS